MTKKPIPSIPAKPKTQAKPVKNAEPVLARARAILERGQGEQMELQFSLAADDPLKVETKKRLGEVRQAMRATRRKP